jgi:imidazolonepropionase-like amidohydrolase
MKKFNAETQRRRDAESIASGTRASSGLSRLLPAACCLLLLVAPAFAQKSYFIRGAKIVPVSGPEIPVGNVAISDGKIVGAGANATAPAGAEVIDGKGLSVYPGMIELGTSMGLSEIGSGAPGTVDLSELDQFNPQAQAFVAVNMHSAHINVTRNNGITSVLSFPRGGVIAGQAAFLNLDGTTPLEMAVIPQAALAINFPAVVTGQFNFNTFTFQQIDLNTALAARDRQLDGLRKFLNDARDYLRAQDAYAKDKSLPRPTRNIVHDALRPYLNGEKPVLMSADRALDIKGAIKFAEEMKLKPIIIGGSESWKAADVLKEKNVPVIVTSVLDMPRTDDDDYDSQFETPGKLAKAGVRFCISTGDTGAHARDLPFQAGMAAAYGLSKEDALKAVTLYPAQIMGVADKMGTIEVGKMANLAVTNGDMLEATSRVRYLFINGRSVSLTSRHTELYDQFKNRK